MVYISGMISSCCSNGSQTIYLLTFIFEKSTYSFIGPIGNILHRKLHNSNIIVY